MTVSLAAKLQEKHPWPAELVPTVNQWPAKRIDHDDQEADLIAHTIEFFWELNTYLSKAKTEILSPSQQSALQQHLFKKTELDRFLSRHGVCVEPLIENGLVTDLSYTCPRGIWNPLKVTYQVEVIEL